MTVDQFFCLYYYGDEEKKILPLFEANDLRLPHPTDKSNLSRAKVVVKVIGDIINDLSINERKENAQARIRKVEHMTKLEGLSFFAKALQIFIERYQVPSNNKAPSIRQLYDKYNEYIKKNKPNNNNNAME